MQDNIQNIRKDAVYKLTTFSEGQWRQIHLSKGEQAGLATVMDKMT